jgi:flagellar basal body P-ring formation protein FlgA
VRAVAAIIMLVTVTTAVVGSASIPEVEISLRDTVRLAERTFTLRDIADLNGSNTNLVSRLERVLMGRTPRAGVSAQIDRDAIAARIDRLLPGISKRVSWTGAPQTRVQGRYQRFDRQGYIDAAQLRLDGWLGERYDNFSAIPAGHYEDMPLPFGKVRLHAEVAKRERVSKRMCVWVDLLVDEQRYSSIPVWFGVSAKAQVYELKRPLSAGARLVPAMLQKNKRDLAYVSGAPVTELAVIEGQRLIRDLPEGTVLTEEVLEPVPDVVKGQELQVRASVGKVVLTTVARALEDGNRGEPIRVERLDGSDNYIARVLDIGLAVVEGGYR